MPDDNIGGYRGAIHNMFFAAAATNPCSVTI